MTPSAWVSLAVKIAVGRRSAVNIRRARARASYRPWAPWPIHSGGMSMPVVASSLVRPACRSRLEVNPNGSACSVADERNRAMAERSKVARGQRTASQVIAHDARHRRDGWPSGHRRTRPGTEPHQGRDGVHRAVAGTSRAGRLSAASGRASRESDRASGRTRRCRSSRSNSLSVSTASTPRSRSAACGRVRNETTTPTVSVRPRLRRRAAGLGVKPSSSITVRIRSRVCGIDDLAAVERSRGGRNAHSGPTRNVADGDGLLGHRGL